MKKITDYYLTYWCNEVTPAVFSVFGLPNKTNNLVENWHRHFNKLAKGTHINFWDFICTYNTKGLL